MLKHRTLTELDKKNLRYQSRPMFVVSLLLIIITSGVAYANCILANDIVTKENELCVIISISSSIVIAFLIMLLSNRKFIIDIRVNQKEIVLRPIQKKEHVTDYEAGSGKTSNISAKEMKAFDSYSVIIDNTRYRVDEEFYKDCSEGDEVEFHYTLKSKFMLSMELAKNHRLNKLS